MLYRLDKLRQIATVVEVGVRYIDFRKLRQAVHFRNGEQGIQYGIYPIRFFKADTAVEQNVIFTEPQK